MLCYNFIGTDKPTRKLLLSIRKEVATHWRDLGMLLLDEDSVSELNIIKDNNHGDVEACCHEVFELWLRKYPEADWNTLMDALKQMALDSLVEKIKTVILKGSYVCLVYL